MIKFNRGFFPVIIKGLVRPIIKFSLRYGISLQDLINAEKSVFVEEAVKFIKKSEEKINISKVSVLTGINRKEVDNLMKKNSKKEHKQKSGILNNVIGYWLTNKNFLTSQGKPKILTKGWDGTFSKLVHCVSSDLSPATILNELIRINAVVTTKQGLKLIVNSYNTIDDLPQTFDYLNDDINNLIMAVEENILADQPQNIHATTEFTNIPDKKIEDIRTWLLKEGEKFHSRVLKYLSKFDKDINKKQQQAKGKNTVVFSTFSRIYKNKD